MALRHCLLPVQRSEFFFLTRTHWPLTEFVYSVWFPSDGQRPCFLLEAFSLSTVSNLILCCHITCSFCQPHMLRSTAGRLKPLVMPHTQKHSKQMSLKYPAKWHLCKSLCLTPEKGADTRSCVQKEQSPITHLKQTSNSECFADLPTSFFYMAIYILFNGCYNLKLGIIGMAGRRKKLTKSLNNTI